MTNFSHIFFQFIFMLSAGSIFFLPLVNSKLTGVGHTKLIVIISMVLSFIASVGFGINSMGLISFFHGILLTLIWIRHQEVRSKEIYFYYFIVVALSILYFSNLTLSLVDQFFVVTSCLILGLINYIMILGHYYLVVPKLTVKPLLVGLKLYWFFLILKLALIFPFESIIVFWNNFFQILMGTTSLTLGQYDVAELSLIFFQQISGYIANPLISYFAYRLCLIRSTQSATGLFYVMVFFALISEMLSLYLLYTKGLRI